MALKGKVDSKGRALFVGAIVKRKVQINKELHGEYSYFKVEKGKRKNTFILSYVRSEVGQMLSKGYLFTNISNVYRGTKPTEYLEIIDEKIVEALPRLNEPEYIKRRRINENT